MAAADGDADAGARRLAARLRFRHLQLLLALRDGGSLRAAAQALNLTQPALSKALGEIESAFGCPLFVRTARGLTPTERGQVALRGAALLLQELAHVQEEVRRGDDATAILRIGAPPFVAHGLLAAPLRQLTAGAPGPGGGPSAGPGRAGLRVQLVEERVPVLLRLLAEGRLDALVSSFPAGLPEGVGPDFAFRKLADTDTSVIAPRGHPLARARSVDWARLASQPWVMPAPGAVMRQVLEESFLRAGCLPPQPVVESSSPVTNVQLVAAGVGLGAVPTSTLAQLGLAGSVQRLRVQPAIASAPVALITRRGVENPRVDYLRRALQR